MDTPNYINHIALVLDASGSMYNRANEAVKVADDQVNYLAIRSKELDQETRMTVYTFNTSTRCVYYDKDVLRLPSLKNSYGPSGQTALIDATLKAIEDLEKTAQLYGDHAFLIYVLTDGMENYSRNLPSKLSNKLATLPDNWTVAVLTPNQQGVFEAKKFGFSPQNITIWDANSTQGLYEAGSLISRTTDNFMQARSKGVRGSKNIFQLDTSSLSPTVVKSEFTPASRTSYILAPVRSSWQISDFVESNLGYIYTTGKAFYQMTKPETVQGYKQICLVDKNTGTVYTSNHARQILGLPDHEVRVKPSEHPQYDIFIQSTSHNRKLVPNTNLLLFK